MRIPRKTLKAFYKRPSARTVIERRRVRRASEWFMRLGERVAADIGLKRGGVASPWDLEQLLFIMPTATYRPKRR